MNLNNKIGQLVMCGFKGTEYNDHLKLLIEKYHVTNFIIFTRNITSPEQLFKLTQAIHSEVKKHCNTIPLIAIDQEGGNVTRIFNGATFLPSAMTITASGTDPYEIGKIAAFDLLRFGINMNYAPILDVNNNQFNPIIGVRSYSDQPEIAGEMACRYINGLRDGGVIATGKHFPGHGDTLVDSHLGMPVVNYDKARLDKVELVPFKMSIKNHVPTLMTAHMIFTQLDSLPATLSSNILEKLLRDELGYEGCVVSDCMEMQAISDNYSPSEAAVLGLKNGLDIILFAHTLERQVEALEAIAQAVKDGILSEAQLDAKFKRIQALKQFSEPFVKDFTKQKNLQPARASDDAYVQDVVDQSLTRFKGKRFLLGRKTLVLCPRPVSQSIAEDQLGVASMIDYGRKMVPHCDWEELPLNSIDLALIEKTKQYEVVVVLTYNALYYPHQARLIEAINATAPEVHVVSLRNPYDLAVLSTIENFVSLYEYTSHSIKTVVSYLNNQVNPNGKIPVKVVRPFKVGASVYVGLAEYPREKNQAYLKKLAQLGYDEIFMSAHMPERDEAYLAELNEMLNLANELGLGVVLDVSKPMLHELDCFDKIKVLRLDWGFSVEDMVTLSERGITIELNASVNAIDEIKYLIASGLKPEQLRVSHNFYPKPETGLDYDFMIAQTQAFKQLGIAVMAFVPSHAMQRPPLSQGLPTLEVHRQMPLTQALIDMANLGIDSVYFGDAYASDAELKTLKDFDTNDVMIPVEFVKGVAPEIKAHVLATHWARRDPAAVLIRFGKRKAEPIKPFNCVERPQGTLTIDNKNLARYNGELCFTRHDLPAHPGVNVIGKVLLSPFSFKKITPGMKFRIIEGGK